MELRDYIQVIRVRKWVVIQAVIIVTLTALVVSLLQPKTYEGTAIVLISEKGSAASIFGDLLPQPERSMQTQVQLMQIRPIAEAAIKTLGLQVAPDELLNTVTVAAMDQTNLVKITVTGTDPKQAALIANTIADEYVISARDAQRASLADAADEVQKRLDQAESDILELGTRVSKSGKSDQLAAELQIATGTYTTMAEKLEQLRINQQLESGPGRVVSPAVVKLDAVSPKPMDDGVLGLAIGLVLGLGMAFLFEYLDNTIKTTEEAEKYYGAPVLGHIPQETYDTGELRRLTVQQRPGSPAAESYRVLRTSLDFVNFEQDIKTLLIASSAPGEGKSTVSANLAFALAQTGAKVVLVNCDFRRPVTDQFFAVNNALGLSDVLLGKSSLKAALQRPFDQNLMVLTAGKMPPNPSELLGSAKMEALTKNLTDWADWVIVDSPPLLAVSDATAFARWADGVLFVSRAGVSTRQAAKTGREMLDRVGARVLGVVVWGLESRAGGGGYGYYQDAYYGAYHYHGYYSQSLDGGRSGKKSKVMDSGAKGSDSLHSTGATDRTGVFIPEKSLGRRIAEGVGNILGVTLGIVLTLVLVAVVAYFLDGYFGWGVVEVARTWMR